MNRLRNLADRVEKEWLAAANHPSAFPNVATRALQELEYDLTQGELDEALAKWLLSPLKLPEQVNVHNVFGQPPITLLNNGKFVVDIYIWLNFDTSIHSHGFRGAFRVLHGQSLQEVFRPQVEKQTLSDVALVTLGKPERTLLHPGDVRTIEPGRELTHRVIHLQHPTVTLCVKTLAETELRQWTYFDNGLAIERRHVQADLVKRIYYYQYLFGQNPQLAQSYLKSTLGQLELSTQMNLFEEVGGHAYDLSDQVEQSILEHLYSVHAKSEWFQRYEEFNLEHVGQLGFTQCDQPEGRLAAHFINAGLKAADLLPYLRASTGREWTGAELRSLVLSLFDVEDLFQREVSHQDRDLARTSLVNAAVLPDDLENCGQIVKLRAFWREGASALP